MIRESPKISQSTLRVWNLKVLLVVKLILVVRSEGFNYNYNTKMPRTPLSRVFYVLWFMFSKSIFLELGLYNNEFKQLYKCVLSISISNKIYTCIKFLEAQARFELNFLVLLQYLWFPFIFKSSLGARVYLLFSHWPTLYIIVYEKNLVIASTDISPSLYFRTTNNKNVGAYHFVSVYTICCDFYSVFVFRKQLANLLF